MRANPLDLTILYRGSLSSCNYDCHYCPFAKRHDTAAQLRVDRQQLERFVTWAVSRRHDDRLAIFFTPWGEALTRRWYRSAIATLSRTGHIAKVAIQTNLSWQTDWISDCDLDRLGLWCTWHPAQVSLPRFVAQCHQLDRHGARYSVGIVGLHEHYQQALRLREQLDAQIYLWVNAYKDVRGYYDDEDIARWSAIDPHFHINHRDHVSLGRDCRTGQSVISVDGEGNIRRCHFVSTVIGNLHERDFDKVLRSRVCTQATCDCHIGYVHMPDLGLKTIFGEGLLERIPEVF